VELTSPGGSLQNGPSRPETPLKRRYTYEVAHVWAYPLELTTVLVEIAELQAELLDADHSPASAAVTGTTAPARPW
jgi:hypothetical protein